MVRINPNELNINCRKKTFIDLLRNSSHVTIEGSVYDRDVPEINNVFHTGPIYLMTETEVNEYLALKHEKEVREVETKEEENNEE